MKTMPSPPPALAAPQLLSAFLQPSKQDFCAAGRLEAGKFDRTAAALRRPATAAVSSACRKRPSIKEGDVTLRGVRMTTTVGEVDPSAAESRTTRRSAARERLRK